MSSVTHSLRIFAISTLLLTFLISSASGLTVPARDGTTSLHISSPEDFQEVNFNGHILKVAPVFTSPPTSTSNPSYARTQTLQKRNDECDGAWSVEGNTATSSPLYDDCRVIRDYARTLTDRWFNIKRQQYNNHLEWLIKYNSCIFGASGPKNVAIMGGDNIADLIITAEHHKITYWPETVRLGAFGYTNCYAGSPRRFMTPVRWALYQY